MIKVYLMNDFEPLQNPNDEGFADVAGSMPVLNTTMGKILLLQFGYNIVELIRD